MRLRRVDREASAPPEFKLTQKVPAERPGPVQGTITNTYLTAAEYDVFAALPANVLSKTRLSDKTCGIDIFDPPLHGLILAEAEFTSDESMRNFRPPSAVVTEVTADPRFTGGRLVRANRTQLREWLSDFGQNLGDASYPRTPSEEG